MSLRTGILVGLYLIISLMLCSFILLMNEDNEGMGTPSIMSPVRSSQKGSILQQIIWSLIFMFFLSCVLLNRMQSSDLAVNQLLKGAMKKTEQSKNETNQEEKVQEKKAIESEQKINDITEEFLREM